MQKIVFIIIGVVICALIGAHILSPDPKILDMINFTLGGMVGYAFQPKRRE